MEPRIIAIANQKGGVGKTTTAINLAACLGERRQRILLIDVDPQANATSGLGVEKEEGKSLYRALLGEAEAAEFIRSTHVQRLDLLPSEVDLAGAEVDIARMDEHLYPFSRAIAPLRESGRYDYILVDCPPSLGILTMNVLTAAHSILLPMQCEYFALEGLSVMMKLVQRLRDSDANAALEIEGIVMTMYDMRTNLSQQVVQEVAAHFGDKVYETLIPRSIRLSEAPSYGQPIILYDGNCVAATAYRNLAKEFLQRRKVAQQAPPEPVPASVEAEPKETPLTPESEPLNQEH